MIIPIVTLDKIFIKPDNNNIYFLDCTRIQGSKKLISRNNYNERGNVEKQIQDISDKLKTKGQNQIILVDDVVFSGEVLRSIIKEFARNGIKVIGIRACISTETSYEYFNKNLEKGLKCGCLLGKDVIDQICERDFYFGIAQSGISVFDEKGQIFKAPYFKPFGNPIERASIPEKYETFFSNGCLLRSMFLWKLIEDKTGKKLYTKDMPEKILGVSENERIVNILKKGLIYDERNNERRENEGRDEEYER